ncbi:MAG: hypothetical protein K2X27_24480 [Candidatus Obscuribacterales bacterium]|nr:hypothetical protein [Candidatus Obscuribacterales bacterium]
MNNSESGTLNRLKGIDVSHHQGIIDWKKVKEAGFDFVFVKATEGGDFVDESFARNRKGAREAGLAVGYYHFFRPSTSVDLQVANFLRSVGALETDALCPVLDCEDPKLWLNYSVKERVRMIVAWCSKVQRALGVTPIIYGSPNFFDTVLENAPELANYRLWIANYNVAEPTLPKPWTSWSFWQNSENGTVPGVSTDVDTNVYNGGDLTKARAKRGADEDDDGTGSIWFRIFCWAVGILYLFGMATVIYEHFCR